ncbi:MAG: glycoside hydrolase family 38 C-terminal domain-containing protein [Candidatus Hydrogenedentota bacterium]
MIPPKAIDKLKQRIALLGEWRYAKVAEVPLEAAETMDHLRVPPGQKNGESLPFKSAPVGSRWGQEWGTVWFRGQARIPSQCAGRRVYYRMDSFADKLLFVNGKPFAGMNPWHREVLLTAEATGRERFTIHIDQYTGHRIPHVQAVKPTLHFHQFTAADPGQPPPLELEASELVVEREATTSLYYGADVLLRTALALDKHALRRARILDELNRALDLVPVHWESEEELEETAKAAGRVIAPLLAIRNSATTPMVGLAGHTHIDVGWLWPIAESTRKAAKTFSSALHLMENYPEMRFLQSQPALLDMIQREYPDIVKRIQTEAKTGRWEPNGGMWVEADCNLTSGESLVRQFLEGSKKTRELFGYRGDTLWLPDVFGYSAALPQILKKCGILNFVTSKINWNDTTRFPYDTFWWEGIDGSEVFTHYITCRKGGYNAEVGPEISKDCWEHLQQKELQEATLSSVGYGDGGGGVTREMCERARRMTDLEGCIKTAFVNVSEFLAHLREQKVARPRWVGELYLEAHRGTYTSQARTKQYNRKLEFLLGEVEFLSVQAMQYGLKYPAKKLERLWRILLTQQFHDILPGSSIRRVYEEAESTYAAMEKDLGQMKRKALKTLAEHVDTSRTGTPYLVSNSLSWAREGFIFIKCDKGIVVDDADGEPVPCQWVSDGKTRGLAIAVTADGLSTTPIYLRKGTDAPMSPFKNHERALETPYYKVKFDLAGKISSLVDRAVDRELVQPGRRLNDLYTAEDMPVFWDAWDIDAFYRDKVASQDRLISREVVTEGPLFITIRSKYEIGRRSALVQEMTFYAASPRIDFKTWVNWQETHTLLKAGFPLDLNTPTFRSEIQFGHVLRNTHSNTFQDQAQFEVCAHKWVDLSEGDYGVALLNDCKYGHDTLDNMLSLTLLKSPLAPDPQADKGEHVFTYTLLPHLGAFTAEEIVREAYNLNVPLSFVKVGHGEAEAKAIRFCSVSNPNVVLETVKKAENGNGVIIRLYEAGNTRGQTRLTFNRKIAQATECNLLEESDTPVKTRRSSVIVPIAPFEIKTLRVLFE